MHILETKIALMSNKDFPYIVFSGKNKGNMDVQQGPLSGLLIIEPKVFQDQRGWFFEAYRQDILAQHGINDTFVQMNMSSSEKGAVRGLHYQLTPHAQGKLVRVTRGSVFDVALDIRRNSPTFGRWFGIELSAENKKAIYIPVGFAHGFCALEDNTEFMYQCTDYYHPESERSISWNDPAIGIVWPNISDSSLMKDKDKNAPLLADAEINF